MPSDLVKFNLGELGAFYLNTEPANAYHLNNSITKLLAQADLVEQHATVFDVGGNCGLFSAFVAKKRNPMRIICFEPDPLLTPVILKNFVGQHDVATLFPVGVGSSPGEATLFVNPVSRQTNSFLRSQVAAFLEGQEMQSVKVNIVTLDDFCRQHDLMPTVLKVDVQGFEGEVLQGAREVLNGVNQLFIETSWLDLNSNYSLIPFAKKYGFQFLYVLNLVAGGADILLTRNELNSDLPLLSRRVDLFENTWI